MTNKDQHKNKDINWRESWLEWEHSPVGNGWDEPSENFWEELSNALPRKRKRRPVLWFLLLLPLSLAGLWLVWSPSNEKVIPVVDSPKIHPNSNTISSTKSSKSTAELPPQIIIPKIEQESSVLLSNTSNVDIVPKLSNSSPSRIASHELSVLTNPPIAPGSLPKQKRSQALAPIRSLNVKPLDIPIRPLPALVVLDAPLQEEESAKIGLFLSAGYAFLDPNTAVSEQNSVLIPLRSRESSVNTNEFNFQLGYKFSKHWSIVAGISSYKIESIHQQRFLREYSPSRELPTGDGRFKSSYDLKMYGNYGVTETNVDFIRTADDAIADGTSLLLNVTTSQRLQMINIPVMVAYQGRLSDFAWSIQTGPSISFLSGQQLSATAEGLIQLQAQDRPRLTRVTNSRELSNISQTLFNWQIDTEFRYHLTAPLSLYFRPEYRIGLQDLYQSEEQTVRLHSFGLGFGLRFDFN